MIDSYAGLTLSMALRCPPHELGDSVELRVCIQRAAMQLLCDLVRADEVCASVIAHCGYHGELGGAAGFLSFARFKNQTSASPRHPAIQRENEARRSRGPCLQGGRRGGAASCFIALVSSRVLCHGLAHAARV
jgi:hypothetical protein